MGSINRTIGTGVTAAFLALATVAGPAFAGTTLQGFLCDDRSAVNFVAPTSKDRRYVIPGINKVVNIIDAGGDGGAGMTYTFNPPVPFQFVEWFYKGTNAALLDMNVRYCISRKDGSDAQTVNVPGGSGNSGGGPVQDGWNVTVQDTRNFPNYVFNGNAIVSKISFIFKAKPSNNITLGQMQFNNVPVSTSLITDIGPCSLKSSCTVAD